MSERDYIQRWNASCDEADLAKHDGRKPPAKGLAGKYWDKKLKSRAVGTVQRTTFVADPEENE